MIKYKIARVLTGSMEDGVWKERYIYRIYKRKFFFWFFISEHPNYGHVKTFLKNVGIGKWIHEERSWRC